MRTSFLSCLVLFAASFPSAAVVSLTVSASPAAPAPVGTLVTWNASAGDNLWYRFRVRQPDGDFRMLRDFGPQASLQWAASEREGSYQFEISVRNRDTGENATTIATYEVTPRAIGVPVISTTANTLVFLYSAPSCGDIGRMRVVFTDPQGVSQSTPYKPCVAGATMNFYLAGMRPETSYSVRHFVDTEFGVAPGPVLTLTTSTPSIRFTPRTPVTSTPVPRYQPLLLQSSLFETIVATDLQGNLVWYYPEPIGFLTRPEPGGLFWGIVWDATLPPSGQVLRQFDLAGIAVVETNAARINEQLEALGRRSIGSFHHEARSLPDGNVLVLASSEQFLHDVQGPGDVDVIGDTILVLDRDLQVVWTWDSFDFMDTTRMAVFNQTCTVSGGCPPLYLAPIANDWLHGNSVQLTPDGNLLYSARHQDWVLKIDYANGAGSGNVIWRMGNGGDFQIQSNDPSPWFSHQHDAWMGDDGTLTLFDNGNTRNDTDPNANSRGQVLRVDENNRVVSLMLNVDLGGYSMALGTAQKLANGNYHFNSGFLPGLTSRATEVDGSGKTVYILDAATPLYRSFRMQDLYTP